ncbi:AAA family ATPase [Maribacter sp. Hel_I_7]|uniref:AAA family ATPase n=1 Tax=Maribacter sp. Hel_I_7 TaxID=1249997 RepID=UPI00068E8464|nr:AAA family ATPase [Maribacter sp. Hel_I_7]
MQDTINTELKQSSDLVLADILDEVITIEGDVSNSLMVDLETVLINPLEQLPPPENCLQIISNGTPSVIATLGNFSLLIGKAKSRKTFLIGSKLASFITNSEILETIKGTAKKGKNEAILFDTEQGKYHLQKTVNRICKLSNTSNPNNFKAYGLRKFKAIDRVKMIEQKIYNSPNLGLVVIDGIRDLVTSINDEDQASNMTSLLLKWTEELNIHIVVVLHQNKNDNNARGHLGAELVNKAETTLSVTKSPQNKDISIVEAEYCRDREPEPFAFEINEEGLPILAENWEVRTASNKRGGNSIELDDFKKFQLLTSIFSKKLSYTYKELWIALQTEHKRQIEKELSDAKSKKLVDQCKNEGWVVQDAERKPYTLGKYTSDIL